MKTQNLREQRMKVTTLEEALFKAIDNDGLDITLETTGDILKNIPSQMLNLALSLGNTLEYLFKGSQNLIDDCITKGILPTLDNRFSKGKKVLEDGSDKFWHVKKTIQDFLNHIKKDLKSKSAKEQGEYIRNLSFYFISFGGGILLGYQTPDKDISAWGIGRHRNFLTHSILPAFAVYVASRILIRIFDKVDIYLDENSPDKETTKVIRKCLSLLSAGFMGGVAAHLLIDGTIQGQKAVIGIGPFPTGSLVKGTLLDDNAFLVINGLFTALMGKELFNKEFEKNTSLKNIKKAS